MAEPLPVVAATDDEVKSIVNLLHSRGIETNGDEVRVWLGRMNVITQKKFGRMIDESHFVRLALEDAKTVTMCLHLHFGDAK